MDWRSGLILVCCIGDGSCEINCKSRASIRLHCISSDFCFEWANVPVLNGTMVRSYVFVFIDACVSTDFISGCV